MTLDPPPQIRPCKAHTQTQQGEEMANSPYWVVQQDGTMWHSAAPKVRPRCVKYD